MIPDVDGLTDLEHLKDAQPHLNRLATHVEQGVNLAAHAMSARPAAHTTEDHLPPLLLLRHAAAQGSGLVRLIRGGNVEPTEPILRSILEAVMSLDYMLQADWTKRALAYQVCGWSNEIESLLALDPATTEGAKHLAAVRADRFISSMTKSVDVASVRQVIDARRRLLSRPPYDAIRAELAATKRRLKKRHVHWYSLHGGPGNLRELSRLVKAEGIYDTLYGSFSERVHATGTMDAVIRTPGGGVLRHLADPTGMERYAVYGASLLLQASLAYVQWVNVKEAIVKCQYYYVTSMRAVNLTVLNGAKLAMNYGGLAPPSNH